MKKIWTNRAITICWSFLNRIRGNPASHKFMDADFHNAVFPALLTGTLVLSSLIFLSPLRAADTRVKLNSSDGSTQFQVRDANESVMGRIDSAGNALFMGSMTVQGKIAGSSITLQGTNSGVFIETGGLLRCSDIGATSGNLDLRTGNDIHMKFGETAGGVYIGSNGSVPLTVSGVLVSSNVTIGGLLQVNNGQNIKLSGGGKFHLDGAGSNIAYIDEGWGMQLRGDAQHPVQVMDGGLVLGDATGGTYNSGRLYPGSAVETYIDEYFGIRVNGDASHPFQVMGSSVGIGVTSPSSLLDVAGGSVTIRGERSAFRIEGTTVSIGGQDYIFPSSAPVAGQKLQYDGNSRLIWGW